MRIVCHINSLSQRLRGGYGTPARHGPSGVHAKPVESLLACDCVTKLSSGTLYDTFVRGPLTGPLTDPFAVTPFLQIPTTEGGKEGPFNSNKL